MIGILLLALYQLLGTAGFVALSPWLLLRAARRPGEMRERLGWAARTRGERPLWLHAASLGELAGVRALLASDRHASAPPGLLTVLSVSARAGAGEAGPGWRAAYAPLDLWFALLPFLLRQRPRGLILNETELWPATLAACRLAGIPVAVISGRLSARRWNATRLARPLLGPGRKGIAGCAAQSRADAERFAALGLPGAVVTGNLKYRIDDASSPASAPRSALPPGNEPFLFVAGSLRRGEEAVLRALRRASRERGLLAVIAPRHRREMPAWDAALRAAGFYPVPRTSLSWATPPRARLAGSPEERSALRSRLAAALAGVPDAAPKAGPYDVPQVAPQPAPQVAPQAAPAAPPRALLLDTHGELEAWYAAADAAFVGGTLAPIGGHNLFEPAREGVPVAFGPHTAGVRDLAEPLLRRAGGREVEGEEDLAAWILELAADPALRARTGEAARAAAREVAGGVERTWAFLAGFAWAGVQTRPEGSDARRA